MVIMNIRHVALLFLCCVCVCVCDISNTVRIVANQTTQNPGNCSVSTFPSGVCMRVLYSEKDSTCIYLSCDNATECDLFIAELGRKTQEKISEVKNGADPLQPSSPSSKSPCSPPPTAPPTASAAPTSSDEDPGQVQTQTGPNKDQENALKSSMQTRNLTLNNPLQKEHQVQPSIQPSTPAPPPTPVSIASVGAENIPSSVPEDHSQTPVNKTELETTAAATTTATTTTTRTPALPTTSTTATNTTITLTTVTPKTTSTTREVTSPSKTTPTLLTSTPPPSPQSSRTPAALPSVTPSTPPPGHHASPAPPRLPEVTSDQGKGMEETAGGELTSRFINTNSLIAVLIFGLLFFVVTVILFLRHAYESYKRRGYTQMDYLINGMYSDSGL